MKSSTRNGLIAVALIGVAGYFAFRYFTRTKRAYINVLLKNNVTTGSSVALMTFDEPFLRAWAKAAKKAEKTFDYSGKTYNTQGGKTV